MKAKELMIGDWVQGFIPDTYSQIGQTTWNGSVIIFTRNGVEIDLNEEDVQPIPLTPEILEKNELDKVPEVSLVLNSATTPMYLSPMIHYVHELQHALRLCGMSELADNLKV